MINIDRAFRRREVRHNFQNQPIQKPNTREFAIQRNACLFEIAFLGFGNIPSREKIIFVNLDALV